MKALTAQATSPGVLGHCHICMTASTQGVLLGVGVNLDLLAVSELIGSPF